MGRNNKLSSKTSPIIGVGLTKAAARGLIVKPILNAVLFVID